VEPLALITGGTWSGLALVVSRPLAALLLLVTAATVALCRRYDEARRG